MTATTSPIEPLATDAPRRRTRLRSWASAALRDVVYAGAVLAWSIAGFAILVTGAAITASLLVLVVGFLVWIGFAYTVRWTTAVDRRLAGWQRHERITADYRRAAQPGVLPFLRTLTCDPQTWRDLLWLAVTAVLGFGSGLLVVTAAGLVITYVSMPLWFWAVSHPTAEYGVTNLVAFTVDTPAEALGAALLGLAVIPLVLGLARVIARGHAGLAVRLLGPAPTPSPTRRGGRQD